MPWHTLINWFFDQDVGATTMNEQIRDNLTVLKTKVDDDGLLRTMFYGSYGNPGCTGSGETDLYSWNVPADTLDGGGQALRIRVHGTLAQNTDTKTLKLYIGAQSQTILQSNASVGTNKWTADIIISYHAATSARLWGVTTKDATNLGSPTVNHVDAFVSSINWASSQNMKITGQGGATDDIVCTSINVEAVR